MEVPFTVKKWDEKPVDEEKRDFPVNTAHVEFDLDGELKGKATIEYLLYYLETNEDNPHMSTSKVSGFLHFEGSYQGKEGTFTAMESGIFDKGNLDCPGTIIDATGELKNLRGSYYYSFKSQSSAIVFNFEG